MFQTAALAGTGLLAASWRGIGLAVRELFATSPGTVVAFLVLVLALDLLVLALVRRRKPGSSRGLRGAMGICAIALRGVSCRCCDSSGGRHPIATKP